MKQIIKIAFADDHSMFRDVIVEKLNKEQNIRVKASFKSGEELINFLRKNQVDIVLIDIDMPGLNGYESISRIYELNPNQKIIVISFHREPMYLFKAFDMRVKAYLEKSKSYDEIVNSIFTVNEGRFYMTDEQKEIFLNRTLNSNNDKVVIEEMFTKREQEVIKLICEAKTAKQIGEQLFISHKTVEGHIGRIKAKVGLKRMPQLLKYFKEKDYNIF